MIFRKIVVINCLLNNKTETFARRSRFKTPSRPPKINKNIIKIRMKILYICMYISFKSLNPFWGKKIELFKQITLSSLCNSTIVVISFKGGVVRAQKSTRWSILYPKQGQQGTRPWSQNIPCYNIWYIGNLEVSIRYYLISISSLTSCRPGPVRTYTAMYNYSRI